jgi:protein SCO1/2
MKSNLWLLFGFAVILGLSVTVTVGLITRPYTFQGSLIDPPVKAAEIQLTDQNRETFHLSDQQGKVVLIFFGYTHCPDVCPVTLTKYKQIKEQLGDQADGVRFVFITVDPERDTPEILGKHVANYDPGVVALTGSRAELEPVWKSYGVYQAKSETESAAGYLVDHTTRIYAIDTQGNWRLTYAFEMPSEAILEDVRQLLKEES